MSAPDLAPDLALDATAPPPRAAPLLPRRGEGDRALVFVVAVLAFLACLSALAAVSAGRAAGAWSDDLAASATVQVRPRGSETSYEASVRAAEALAGVKGVAQARALDRAAAEALLKPWLGDAPLPADLPIPLLVAVDLDPKAPATPPALRAALAAAGVDATLEDHGRWSEEIRRSALWVQGACATAFVIVAAAAAAATAYATRAGLAARRDVVEVLHLTGAEDRFVADLFMRRFAALGATAGALGMAAAAVPLLALAFAAHAGGLLSAPPLAFSDALVLLPCPLVVAAVAAGSARRTALRLLRQEP
jgi:cell division transport system permease protein